MSATLSLQWSGMTPRDLANRAKSITGGYAKVGILQSTNARDNSNLAPGSTGIDAGNADVGYANEFGSRTGYTAIDARTGKKIHGAKIPERSFLRMPLMDHLEDKAALIGAGVRSALVGDDTPKGATDALGIAAVSTVREAFDTNGFGQWEENSRATIAFKGGQADPLIATGQLRDSITSQTVQGALP